MIEFPRYSQVARFRAETPASTIAEALGFSSNAMIVDYPYGAHWTLPASVTSYVISVSLQEDGANNWLLRIEPSLPIRPNIVRRAPITKAESLGLARDCYEAALRVHEAIRQSAKHLRWSLDDDPDVSESTTNPIKPRADDDE